MNRVRGQMWVPAVGLAVALLAAVGCGMQHRGARQPGEEAGKSTLIKTLSGVHRVMENLSAEPAQFERTGSDGDHLAEGFHEESDAMHEEENRGGKTN